MKHPDMPPFQTIVGLQAGLLGLGFILLKQLPQPTSQLGKLGPAAWLWGLIAALVTYALLAGINRYSKVMQRNTLATLGRLQPLFARLALWQLVLISALAGIGEELVFRAFLQPFISSYSNMWVGLIAASLVFALLHFMSWIYFVLAFAMGLLLGAAYQLSQGLVLVMVWHGVYDLLALWVLVHAPQLLGLPAKPLAR